MLQRLEKEVLAGSGRVRERQIPEKKPSPSLPSSLTLRSISAQREGAQEKCCAGTDAVVVHTKQEAASHSQQKVKLDESWSLSLRSLAHSPSGLLVPRFTTATLATIAKPLVV